MIKSKSEIIQGDSCNGYLVDSDEKESRKIIDSLKHKDKIIAVVARDDFFNRRALETLKINYLVGLEANPRSDTLKQRSSGLNHVLAKIARDKKITIIVNLGELIKSDKDEKARRISRIIQNIKICRKANCDIKFATFAKSKDELIDEFAIKSLAFSLGMSSQQANVVNEF